MKKRIKSTSIELTKEAQDVLNSDPDELSSASEVS